MFKVGDRVICIGWNDIPSYDHDKHVLEDHGYEQRTIYEVTGIHDTQKLCGLNEIIINNVIIINRKYFRRIEDIRDEKLDDLLNG